MDVTNPLQFARFDAMLLAKKRKAGVDMQAELKQENPMVDALC